MGKLGAFKGDLADNQCWARVDLEDGSPIWISLFGPSITIKKSSTGVFGKTLLKENSERRRDFLAAALYEARGSVFDEGLYELLDGFCITSFTQAAIDSSTIDEFVKRLNWAVESI